MAELCTRHWERTSSQYGYRLFMAERASFVSTETMRYYKEKPESYVLWCEKRNIADITLVKGRRPSQVSSDVRRAFRPADHFEVCSGDWC